MSRRLAAAVGVLALVGAVAVAGVAPAVATGNQCRAVTVSDTSAVAASGEGSAALTGSGLRMRTPVQASRVRWETPVSGAFASLSGLSYRTHTYADGDRGFATVAARVRLDTDADGTAETTLVFEPYFNGTVAEGGWQSWDAVGGGAGRWWWAEEPGNPQTTRPWSHWQATYPGAAVVAVNVGMGTWNEGADAKVDGLRVQVRSVGCQRFEWKAPPSATTPAPTPTVTGGPTPTPTVTATAAPTPTITPTAAPTTGGPAPDPTVPTAVPDQPVGDEDPLPTTGAGVVGLGLAGAALLAAGAGALVFARRRRTRFTT